VGVFGVLPQTDLHGVDEGLGRILADHIAHHASVHPHVGPAEGPDAEGAVGEGGDSAVGLADDFSLGVDPHLGGFGVAEGAARHDDVGADHVHVSGGPEGYPGDMVGAEDLGVEQLGQVAFEAFLLDDVDGGVGGGDFGAAAGHASEAAAVDGQEVIDDEAGADLAQALRGDLGDHVALEALVLQEKGVSMTRRSVGSGTHLGEGGLAAEPLYGRRGHAHGLALELHVRPHGLGDDRLGGRAYLDPFLLFAVGHGSGSHRNLVVHLVCQSSAMGQLQGSDRQ
jgi:hypothetical protein